MRIFFLAHILVATNSSSSGSLTYGTPASALIFALTFTAVILCLYLLVDRLPRPKKNKITSKNEPKFIKTMIVFAAGAMLAAGLDAWWHVAIGREAFWVPPHIFLYGFSTAAIILSFYVWWYTRSIHWKHTYFTLLFFPIAGAFDNYWHTVFGSENLANPKMMAWSPAHMLLMIAGILTVVQLLIALHRYRKTEDFSFFGNLSLGVIASVLYALAIPFHPTEGWGQVAGFAGAGVVAFVLVSVGMAAQKIMKGRTDATLTTIFMMVIVILPYTKEVAPQITVLPHDTAPLWLIVFSFLIPAVLLDFTRDIFQPWTRGLMAAVAWSAILFGFSTQFFQPQFQYGITETVTTIVFSALGGLTVGSLFSLHHLTDEKHIEKLLKKF